MTNIKTAINQHQGVNVGTPDRSGRSDLRAKGDSENADPIAASALLMNEAQRLRDLVGMFQLTHDQKTGHQKDGATEVAFAVERRQRLIP